MRKQGGGRSQGKSILQASSWLTVRCAVNGPSSDCTLCLDAEQRVLGQGRPVRSPRAACGGSSEDGQHRTAPHRVYGL